MSMVYTLQLQSLTQRWPSSARPLSMTVIERTAYPQLSSHPTTRELTECYTPTSEEVEVAQVHTRTQAGLLAWVMMLKTFQVLKYFVNPPEIPQAIIEHLRTHLKLPASLSGLPPERSLRRYQEQIRAYLGVSLYHPQGQILATNAISKLSEIRDDPADLFNAALVDLVEQGYELPAFSTLDRLVRQVRTATNQRLWEQVAQRLPPQDCAYLDRLITAEAIATETVAELGEEHQAASVTLSLLKGAPKRPSLSHLRELQQTFELLMDFGDAQQRLAQLAPSKVKAFAAQARALDAGEFKDMAIPKRRTLLLCLLHHAQVKTRDHLAEMFIHRMSKIHQAAKNRLVELREQHLKQTETLLGVLSEVLQASAEHSSDTTQLGHAVQGCFGHSRRCIWLAVSVRGTQGLQQ